MARAALVSVVHKLNLSVGAHHVGLVCRVELGEIPAGDVLVQIDPVEQLAAVPGERSSRQAAAVG